MDTVKRFVRFGFLAVMTCLFAGCATLGQSPGVVLEASAPIMHRDGIVCRTEAVLLELVASSQGKDLETALAAMNEKYAAEYKGESACVFGMFSYIVAASGTSPRVLEIDGVRHVLQKIVVFGTALPDGSLFVFKNVSEGYRVTRVNPPGTKDAI